MAKNDQQEAYEKLLSASLARVNDWVKFAEAKNAALLAFSSACTVAIGNMLTKQPPPTEPFDWILPLSASLFIIAALISMFSFMPRTSIKKFFRGEAAVARQLNLVFYGDIKHVNISEFPEKLRQRYMPLEENVATEGYLTDLACQIHINSSIASRKFALFRVASWIALASLVALTWPAIRHIAVATARLIVGIAQ